MLENTYQQVNDDLNLEERRLSGILVTITGFLLAFSSAAVTILDDTKDSQRVILVIFWIFAIATLITSLFHIFSNLRFLKKHRYLIKAESVYSNHIKAIKDESLSGDARNGIISAHEKSAKIHIPDENIPVALIIQAVFFLITSLLFVAYLVIEVSG